MQRLIRLADAACELAGRIASWLALGLVALVFGLVAARYLFNAGSIAAQELALWLHGGLFLLALGYAYKHDQHVRVDVFSQRWGKRARAWVELAGIALLLLPLCVFALWISYDYVAASWTQREGSNSGGLPGWFLVKTLIPIAFALLALQALAQALRAWTRATEKGG